MSNFEGDLFFFEMIMTQGRTTDGWMHLVEPSVATTLGNLEELNIGPKFFWRIAKNIILTKVLIDRDLEDSTFVVQIDTLSMWRQMICFSLRWNGPGDN